MTNKTITILVSAMVGLAILGFADSAFLLAERLSGKPIPCVLGFTGCDEVSRSPYSVLLGIPLSLYGTIFYLLVALLGVLYLDLRKQFIAKLLAGSAGIGFLLSLYFLYVQGFLIGTFCVWCIGSAIIATMIFFLSIALQKMLKIS